MEPIKSHIAALLLILSLNLLLHLRTLKLPLHPDSGLFLYRAILSRVGERFVYGRRTGKGVFDFVGDYSRFQIKYLVYVFMNTLYRCLPPDPKAFRIFFALYNGLTALALYAFAGLTLGWAEGAFGAIIFVLLSANPFSDSHQLHAEHYAVLPIILSLLSLLIGIKGHVALLIILCGLLMGIVVFLFKITFLADLVAVLTLPLLFAKPLFLLYVLLGVLILVSLIYAGCRLFDTLPSFYAMMNIFTAGSILRHYKNSLESQIQSGDSNNHFSPRLILALSSWSLPVLLLLCLLFAARFQAKPIEWFVLIWISCSTLGLVAQGKYYQAHLFPLYPSLSLICGISLSWVLQYNLAPHFPFLGWALLLLTAIFLLLWLAVLLKWHFVYTSLQYHIKKYSLRDYQTLSFLAVEAIADYIRSNSPAGSRILQWGYHQELYVLAQRRSAVGPHLENSLQTDPALSDPHFGPVWREWLLEAVAKQQPLLIVDTRGSLDIECLSRGTGLSYVMERLFYGLFPVYRLNHKNAQPRMGINVMDLTSKRSSPAKTRHDQTLEERIKHVNHLFNKGERDTANREAGGGVDALLRDWVALNS
jgi:hypothetical protein